MDARESVKQHRPTGTWGVPPEIRAYIERLENAIDHIAHKAEGSLYPVDNFWEDHWRFLYGKGKTFLEAVEDNESRDRQP